MPANSTNTPVDDTTNATTFESSPNPALNGDRSFDTPEGAKAMLADYARRASSAARSRRSGHRPTTAH